MSTKPRDDGTEAQQPTVQAYPMPDFEALSRNVARFVEEAGKATAAMMKPIERGEAKGGIADEAGDIVKTLGLVAEKVLSDPQKVIEVQAAIATNFLTLWSETLKKMQGEPSADVAQPDPKDARHRLIPKATPQTSPPPPPAQSGGPPKRRGQPHQPR